MTACPCPAEAALRDLARREREDAADEASIEALWDLTPAEVVALAADLDQHMLADCLRTEFEDQLAGLLAEKERLDSEQAEADACGGAW
jgi:hypothetical protein